MSFLGVDVGGTKIEIGEFDSRFKLIKSQKYATADYLVKTPAFAKDVLALTKQHVTAKIKKIGISWNSVIGQNKITYSSLLGGTGLDIVQLFKKEFAVPTVLENDVNCMAKAERDFGFGRGVDSFVLMNIGTGLRFSFVAHGQLVRGFSGNCGEVSQLKVTAESGKKKIIMDNYFSGMGLALAYKELSGGQTKTSQEIFFESPNDPVAQKTRVLFKERFVQVLQMVSYFYNPELIILNGSLKKAHQLYLKEALTAYRTSTMPFFHFRKIKISKIDHGACLGSLLN